MNLMIVAEIKFEKVQGYAQVHLDILSSGSRDWFPKAGNWLDQALSTHISAAESGELLWLGGIHGARFYCARDS